MSETLREQGWVLQPSEECDIDVLMKWFPDEASVRLWGGPIFRYPFNRHSFAEDIHWGRMASFSLRKAEHELAAFGQVYPRNDRIHFARLVSHPRMRREGIGRRLIEMLMTLTPRSYDFTEFSLFVFRDNLPAYNCYRSLGFEVVDYPDDAPLADACYYLTRPVAARPDNNQRQRGQS